MNPLFKPHVKTQKRPTLASFKKPPCSSSISPTLPREPRPQAVPIARRSRPSPPPNFPVSGRCCQSPILLTSPLPSSCPGATLSIFLCCFCAAGSRRSGARRSSSQQPRRPGATASPHRRRLPQRPCHETPLPNPPSFDRGSPRNPTPTNLHAPAAVVPFPATCKRPGNSYILFETLSDN